MKTLEIILLSYIVLSQVITAVIIFSRCGKKLYLLLLIFYPFGLIVSVIDDMLKKKQKFKKRG
jgi:uncharacterized membrane protein